MAIASASSTPPKPALKKRCLVLETSALIAILDRFADPYTYSIEAFESLIAPVSGRQKPLVDGIYIPDHVFYEFTGILPISIPRMMEWFARAAHDPAELNKAIEFYVTVSPRTGEGVKNQDMNRDQIRTLLRFIAKYPDSLGYDVARKQWRYATPTAEHYVGRLKAEHAVLGGVGVEVPDNYRPTIGNVMDALGDGFNVDRLRLHAGQLFMMGFLTEDEYNVRMERDGIGDEKSRFMKITDFASHLLDTKKWITEPQRDRLREVRDQQLKEALNANRKQMRAAGHSTAEIARANETIEQDMTYLTVGFLKQFSHLLTLYRDAGNQKLAKQNQLPVKPYGQGKQLVEQSVRPCRMLVEHYVYGGIIPPAARFDVAAFLGFDMQRPQASDARGVDKYLDEQGFYERALTTVELKSLYQHLQQKSREGAAYDEAELAPMKALTEQLPRAIMRYRTEFDRACQNPRAAEVTRQKEMEMPTTGIPYEKVFSEELINGTITFNQFFQLAQQGGALTKAGRQEPNLFATHTGDILISYDGRGEGGDSVIWIRQSGQQSTSRSHDGSFISRSGVNHLGRHYTAAGEVPAARDQLYWRFSAAELLERCRQSRGYSGEKDPLGRALESIMYRGVTQSASQLRALALPILGEETLIQIEKDFSTRHARKWIKHLPPFTNPMAAMHVARRIARKNMGEIATAEMATTISQAEQDMQVWIVNHDSDLYPTPEGEIRFTPDIKRMHSGRYQNVKAVEELLKQDSQQGRIEFLRTDQLLDTMSLLLNHHRAPVSETMRKREPYPGLRIKESMAAFDNREWQHKVHEPLVALRSRTR